MIYKSYILEQSFDAIKKTNLFLFYGENQGLKKEFKEQIKKEFKSEEILNLFQDEILKNENILLSEINNRSLFDTKKIIIINQVSDKIFDLIEDCSSSLKEDKLFLFSDILDKRSKIRNFFEKSKTFGTVPCYQDNEITLKKIITTKLKDYEGLNNQVVNLILQNSSFDRDSINNEIGKITSFFKDKKIEFDKLEFLLNLRSNDDFNLLKDEAIKGNRAKTNRLLADTIFETENNIYYLNAINQRINKINEIVSMKVEGSNIEMAVTNLKPPVFWKDKPVLIEQAKKWDKIKILTALNKTYETELQLKSNSSIKKDLLIKNLIVDLCCVVNSA